MDEETVRSSEPGSRAGDDKVHPWSVTIPSAEIDSESSFDVVIVGGGIAGSSLGYALGKRGYSVLIIERSVKEPDRIVGELLQPGGVLRLQYLGLESCIEGIDGIEVHGYAVVLRDERERLKYPKHEGKEVLGKSFHHGRFVQQLRKAAASVPSVKFVQGNATQLVEDKDVIIGIDFSQGEGKNRTTKRVYGALNVVCEGWGSNLRKTVGLPRPEGKSQFVGLILENCQLPFPKHGHVFLGEPAPILGYQIGSNEIRILVDIPEPVPTGEDLVEFLRTKTAPQLPVEIRQAFYDALDRSQIRKMSNLKLHTNESYLKEGLVFVGDSWNMRHPLTGGGMTVALSDVCILRDVLVRCGDLRDRSKVTRSLQQFFIERKPLASTINILAFALYQVFCSPIDPKYPSMRTACFNYFKLGGRCTSGPMSLLSGLCPNPYVLLMHFFSVAIYGVYQSLKPFPTPYRIFHAYKLLSAASWIVIPLMRGEKIFAPFTFILSILFYNFNKTKSQ
eukprot:TRINITY_DN2777_c0_g1_i3.p1 TRINITY_DN2777_c0_g1~~TRINITY_DN2777_c0_g1_i3.p1  ORF type:complete len:505 (+),score=90.28 TRINITY_DN2777_c0_g1_i3:123-1637(+)